MLYTDESQERMFYLAIQGLKRYVERGIVEPERSLEIKGQMKENNKLQ